MKVDIVIANLLLMKRRRFKHNRTMTKVQWIDVDDDEKGEKKKKKSKNIGALNST